MFEFAEERSVEIVIVVNARNFMKRVEVEIFNAGKYGLQTRKVVEVRWFVGTIIKKIQFLDVLK